jgi:hypothetical protein
LTEVRTGADVGFETANRWYLTGGDNVDQALKVCAQILREVFSSVVNFTITALAVEDLE